MNYGDDYMQSMNTPVCRTCGAGLTDGKTLLRQNAKGEPGVWACEEHSGPAPNDVAQIVAEIQLKRNQK